MAKKLTERKVRDSLIEQLENKGVTNAALLSMVDDYMRLWASAQELKSDLETRGAVTPYTTTSGEQTMKPNPSLKELRDTNKQMLLLARHLGIEPDKLISGEDDEM